VIEAVQRFAPSRPLAATRQLLLVALWLSEAAAHLGRAARGLDETTAWIAVSGGPVGVPQRIADATFHWIEASRRLVEVSKRLDATFAQLHGHATRGVIRLESQPTTDAGPALNRSGCAESPSPIALFIIEPRPAARVLAGARSISRGRAPPPVSIFTL
jgi:hypothetical protein